MTSPKRSPASPSARKIGSRYATSTGDAGDRTFEWQPPPTGHFANASELRGRNLHRRSVSRSDLASGRARRREIAPLSAHHGAGIQPSARHSAVPHACQGRSPSAPSAPPETLFVIPGRMKQLGQWVQGLRDFDASCHSVRHSSGSLRSLAPGAEHDG